MRYSDVFGSCHPAVNFLYFALVIAFSMCLTHPVCLLLSVCGAVIYHAVLLGPRSLRKSAVWMVPMAVLAAKTLRRDGSSGSGRRRNGCST